MGRLAADTCFWPLYEVVNGQYRLTYRPKVKKPLSEWIAFQGRFKHLTRPENKPLLDEMQADVDKRWEELLGKETARPAEDPAKSA
jgi:pyruvate ferredoxin oxidoreductase beta subunit